MDPPWLQRGGVLARCVDRRRSGSFLRLKGQTLVFRARFEFVFGGKRCTKRVEKGALNPNPPRIGMDGVFKIGVALCCNSIMP